MHIDELLYQVDKHGVTLRCDWTEDRLHYMPAGALPENLVVELKKHKHKVIQILREDEEYRRTGIIQCKRQVFELALEYFGEDNKA